MVKMLHTVNQETCKGDGICVDICPEGILGMVDGKAATVESRADECIMCGQCIAVCPTESIQMPQLPAGNFQALSRKPLGYEEFLDFLSIGGGSSITCETNWSRIMREW